MSIDICFFLQLLIENTKYTLNESPKNKIISSKSI